MELHWAVVRTYKTHVRRGAHTRMFSVMCSLHVQCFACKALSFLYYLRVAPQAILQPGGSQPLPSHNCKQRIKMATDAQQAVLGRGEFSAVLRRPVADHSVSTAPSAVPLSSKLMLASQFWANEQLQVLRLFPIGVRCQIRLWSAAGWRCTSWTDWLRTGEQPRM